MEQGSAGRKPQFALVKNGETHRLSEGVNLVGRKNPGAESQSVQVALEVRLGDLGQLGLAPALPRRGRRPARLRHGHRGLHQLHEGQPQKSPAQRKTRAACRG